MANNKILFWMGLLGIGCFGLSSFLGELLIDDYDPISQFISETMAVDRPYSPWLRYLGYIPSGVLLTLFAWSAYSKFPQSTFIKVGFYGLGVFYGMATIVVGIFPCDQGCNKDLIDPSLSQIIHNLTGMMTYLIVPVCILMIGIGLGKFKTDQILSKIGIIIGILCLLLVGLLSDPLTTYAGLFQRMLEGLFMLWILACCIYIRRNNAASSIA